MNRVSKKKRTATLLMITTLVVLFALSPLLTRGVHAASMLAPDLARKMVIDRFGGGIVQKIEYAYDNTNPQYKGEAIKSGRKVVFEINAKNATWAKWDEGNDNQWDKVSKILGRLVTMDQAASSVIAKSGKTNTFLQKIEYNHDDSEPKYQGEAFNLGVKYSFEINAFTGAFKKFDTSDGDETFRKQYANVAPSATGSATPKPPTTEKPVTENPVTEKPGQDDDDDDTRTKRLSGSNRYETAIAISKERMKSAQTVLLANGSSQIDALASAPLAQRNKAPLLLTGGQSLEASVKAEIQRLGAKKVILIGGTSSVSPAIESSLRNMGLTIERLQGGNRYATSAVLANAVPSTSGRAFLANGVSAVDALGIGSYAAENGIPILLTNENSLDDDVEKALSGVKNLTIIGGVNSVSDALLQTLRSKGIEVNRISGGNRYETSAIIASTYYKTPTKAVFATGRVLADGLTGAGLAADSKAPMILVGTNLDSRLSTYLKGINVDSIYLLGGTSSISDSLRAAIVAATR